MLNYILGFSLLSVSSVAYCLILSSVGETKTMGRSRLKETISDDAPFEQEGVCSCAF